MVDAEQVARWVEKKRLYVRQRRRKILVDAVCEKLMIHLLTRAVYRSKRRFDFHIGLKVAVLIAYNRMFLNVLDSCESVLKAGEEYKCCRIV